MYACNGILFNHESPRRGETFVTRKITRGLANIALGLESCLHMGNIDALRDWGHAKDYVRMQWLMLQQDEAKDYVIATNKQYSVREFITWSANALGIDIEFRSSGIDEVGVVAGISGDLAHRSQLGKKLLKLIRATLDLQKLRHSWEIHPKPKLNWDGSLRLPPKKCARNGCRRP